MQFLLKYNYYFNNVLQMVQYLQMSFNSLLILSCEGDHSVDHILLT